MKKIEVLSPLMAKSKGKNTDSNLEIPVLSWVKTVRAAICRQVMPTITRKLADCGYLLEIAVLDHLIIAEENYYSLRLMACLGPG